MNKVYFFVLAMLITASSISLQAQSLLPIQQEAWDKLYQDCNGENWTIKTYDELKKRKASPYILLDNNGTNYNGTIYDFIETFDLSNNNLNGVLPEAIVKNSNYERPSFFPAVAQYTKLILSHNEITEVPDGIGMGGLNYIWTLKLDNNKISNFHVSEYDVVFSDNYGVNIGAGCKVIELQQNDISSLKSTDLGQRSHGYSSMIDNKAEYVRIDNNRLDFESLVEVIPYIIDQTKYKGIGLEGNEDFYIDYLPQKALGKTVADISANKGTEQTLSFSLKHKQNVYSWELNGKPVPLSESKEYTFSLSAETAGIYKCKITNPLLPDAYLHSKGQAVFMNKAGNKSISDFQIIHDAITENFPEGVIVADFQGDDPDGDEVFYRLVEGEANNSSFRMKNGKTLVSSETLFNREYLTEYKVKVEAYDVYGGRFTKEFTITKGEGGDTQLPEDITLSNLSINENIKDGKIGKLVTVGVNGYSFEFDKASDSELFYIKNDSLLTKVRLDYEMKNEYVVRIKAVAADGTKMKKDFTIKVQDVNDAPHRIILTDDIILTNKPAGTLVGLLVAADQDPTDIAFSFELCEGYGDTHNKEFAVQNNSLYNTKTFAESDLGSKSIRIRVKDDEDAVFETSFSISIQGTVTENKSPRGIGLTNTTIWNEFSTEQTIAYIFMSDPEGEVGSFSTNSEYISIQGSEVILKKRPAANQYFDAEITGNDGQNEISFEFRFYLENASASTSMNPDSPQISMYPNPATNYININQTGDARVYSLAGTLLMQELNTNTLEVSSLPAGTYILKHEVNGQNFTTKFIKQ